MRVKSLIILSAIIFGILSPLSLHLTLAHGHVSIEGLDVCHAGSFALSAGHDAPFVNEPLYQPYLPSHNESAEMVDSTPRILITAFQDEDPPKP